MALGNPARLGGAFILLALLGAGCGGGSGDDAPAGADTEATATEESPAVRKGELLLQDDFSDPESGWPSIVREEGRADYVEGAYRVVAKQAGRQVWSNVAGPTVRGLRMEFEATQLAGGSGDLVGARCLTDIDLDVGYLVGIAPAQGGYALAAFRGDDYRLLESSGEPAEAVRALRQENQLRVECLAPPGGPIVLTLEVNGEALVRAEDEEGEGEDGFDGVGLFVDTTDGGAEALFDDVVMTELLHE